MSGHSKWAKIHRKKGVADAKRGAAFTKAGNLISLAAKQGGGDLNANFKLRLAVEKARSVNMPKDKIENAIARGAGTADDGAILEETTYEIFGPKGTAFVVEAITDNKNRTLSDIKLVLNKASGNLADSGSTMWMFERRGVIMIAKNELAGPDEDETELKLIDAGADNIIKEPDELEIHTPADKLQETINNIQKLDIKIQDSSLAYIAKEELKIEETDIQEKIEKLFTAIGELDDVNNIYTNASY